jgi:hypothetical protein
VKEKTKAETARKKVHGGVESGGSKNLKEENMGLN